MKVLMTCDAVGGVWQYANDLAQALAGEGVQVVLAVLGPSNPLPAGERDRRGTRQGEGTPDGSGAPVDPSPDLAYGSATRIGSNMPTACPEQPGGLFTRCAPEGRGEIEVIHTNLPLDWLATGPADVRATAQAVATLATEHAVDLIHLNSPALAAAAFPAPVVAVAHGCPGTWFASQNEPVPTDLHWHEHLTRAGLRAADAVIAPTASYAAAVQRHYALPIPPQVVHNGRAPAALADVPQADHVLTAGRLWDRVKNTALLDAVAALLPVPLRAAGPVTAPHGESVATRHLDLLGTLDADALAAEYARAPIFISAPRFEPFGLAVLEAAQAGCPLVVSGIDTFRELWTGAALIVPDDDPHAYAAAVERIRTEAGLRDHLSHAARTRAARYTPAAMAAGVLAIYRDLLTAPARVAA